MTSNDSVLFFDTSNKSTGFMVDISTAIVMVVLTNLSMVGERIVASYHFFNICPWHLGINSPHLRTTTSVQARMRPIGWVCLVGVNIPAEVCNVVKTVPFLPPMTHDWEWFIYTTYIFMVNL